MDFHNISRDENKFRHQSIKSILSGPSYKSDEIQLSLQIDEQIATHEQYLEKLRQLKAD